MLLILAVSLTAFCQQNEIGYVEKSKGEASKFSGGEWEIVKRGDIIMQGERLKTTGIGFVKVRFTDNDGYVLLAGESEVIISMFSSGKRNEKVASLLKGSLFASTDHAIMRIEASDALITADSAEVYVSLSNDSVRAVCIEGSADAVNPAGESALMRGEEALLLSGMTPFKKEIGERMIDVSIYETEMERVEIEMENENGDRIKIEAEFE